MSATLHSMLDKLWEMIGWINRVILSLIRKTGLRDTELYSGRKQDGKIN